VGSIPTFGTTGSASQIAGLIQMNQPGDLRVIKAA
jgi:hypothetical protein